MKVTTAVSFSMVVTFSRHLISGQVRIGQVRQKPAELSSAGFCLTCRLLTPRNRDTDHQDLGVLRFQEFPGVLSRLLLTS